MAQDYKHVRRASGGKRVQGTGVALPFLAGLSIGLLAAFALYLYYYQGLFTGEAPRITVRNAAGRPDIPAPQPAPEPRPEPPPPTFDFYRILPSQEVSMSEWEAEAPANGEVDPSGDRLFVLQVGSFKTAEAADQTKAEVALIGIEADVQRVVINGQDVLHRVRIGPFKDKQAFQETRQRLISNDLDFVVLKLKAGETAGEH
ncbi:MAG: SPOR domain-containing protein [Gammaproteobacteria bacterium]|nr:SPOR domain-containing protein [Gammaproteobacteria bacterium]